MNVWPNLLPCNNFSQQPCSKLASNWFTDIEANDLPNLKTLRLLGPGWEEAEEKWATVFILTDVFEDQAQIEDTEDRNWDLESCYDDVAPFLPYHLPCAHKRFVC